MVIVLVHEAQFEFSCHGTCEEGSTKKGQGDVSGIPDIRLQYSVTLCGASLVAGNAAADVFTLFSLSRTPWARGCIDWRAPFCRLNQFLAGVEAVSLKTRSTFCVRLCVLLWQQTAILVNFLYRHAKSLLLKSNIMTLIHVSCFRNPVDCIVMYINMVRSVCSIITH